MQLMTKARKMAFLSTCAQLRDGRLTLRTPEGETYRFGSAGPEAEMVIRDWRAVSALASSGQVGLGEAYVMGLWDSPSVEGVTALALRNRDRLGRYASADPLRHAKHRVLDRVLRANTRRGARRNIRAHYDVGNEFYQIWLDDGMNYSAAMYAEGDADLGRAQQRKNARALSRLGQAERVLEIGCGWGALAEQAADEGRHVTGITISGSQHSYADSRLDGRADIQLQDYRDMAGRFDAIVSIEMVEAVGERYWGRYFATLKRCLAPGGRALIQAITVPDDRFESYRASSDYIRQHVFPGGMLLCESAIRDQADRAGLRIQDQLAFGQDYARTCRAWAQRLRDQKHRIDRLGYGDAFYRNWTYYLDICAASFAVGHTDVVQVELSHS